MNDSNDRPGGLSRRDLIKGAALAGMGLATGTYGALKASGDPPSSGSAARDLIRHENAKPGTRDWMLTNTRTDPKRQTSGLTSGRSPGIEGYCSANSVRAGEKLQIMVSTNPASAFKLEIFRTGYYNGDGARLVRTYEALQGTQQPDPPIGENYVRECQWEPSVEFEIPKDWVSLFPFSLAYPPATACIHSAILG